MTQATAIEPLPQALRQLIYCGYLLNMETSIALICLAYSGKTSAIEWMAHYFRTLDATIFVHVDEKVSDQPYQHLKGLANIQFVMPRRRIFWGGFQTVEAIINSIEWATIYRRFDRYMIVTEDTIPIRQISDFRRRIAENADYIVAAPVSAASGLKRYRGFYCYDDTATCPRTPHDERVVGPELLGKLQRLEALRAKGKSILPKLYQGSTWWCLSADSLQKILERHNADTQLRESFEFSAVPEEQYFQTVYGETNGETRRPLMIADFSRHPRPYVFSDPDEILSEAAKYPCLFIRKVDVGDERIKSFVASLASS